MDCRLPELLSCSTIVTEDGLNLFLVVGSGQEHLIAHDRRRTVSTAGNGSFPEDTLRRAPFQRRFLLRRGNAIAVGAAPPGPVRLRDRDSVGVLLRWGFLRARQGE